MFQVITRFTTACAGLALVGLPMLAGAQTTPASQPATPARAASQQKTPAPGESSPQHHLDQARRALTSIDGNTLTGEARTALAELQRQFGQLEDAWRAKAAAAARASVGTTGHAGGHTGSTTSGTATGAGAGTTGTPEQAGATGAASARQTPRATPPAGTTSENWLAHYQAIDGLLDRLMGETVTTAAGTPGMTTGAATGTTGAGPSAKMTLDPATRTKLSAFRRQIDLFHASAIGQAEKGEEDAAIARLSAQIDDVMASASMSATSGTIEDPVGTAGTSVTTGPVCVDRAKLEQLKRDIYALHNGSRR